MELIVMSLNLRYDKPDPGTAAWSVRREAVTALVSYYAPDLMGSQEGQAHQLLDLHRYLKDYQSLGGDRLGNGRGEACAIFYRPQRLTCREWGEFWLSETPEVPGSITPSWGNLLPRMVTWACFSSTYLAAPLLVFNTHFDYGSATARDRSAQLLRARIAQMVVSRAERWGMGPLVLVLGDFNAGPGDRARRTLQGAIAPDLHLVDTVATLPPEDQLTFHDFSGVAFDAVDTIYCDRRLRLQWVTVDRQSWQGIWPSDHHPVVASVRAEGPV